MQSIHVLAIAGSLRKRSYNRALIHTAAAMAPENMTIEIFDLLPIPMFNTDVEAVGNPESVEHFRARLAAADALLISTPEYNFSISGALKNAIDWASRGPSAPIDGKPVAIMGVGGGLGAVRALTHLRQILIHNDMHVLNKPALMLARGWELFDDDLNLTDDSSRERLGQLLDALAAWTERLR